MKKTVLPTETVCKKLYPFNPRYPFLQELNNFLAKAYLFLPQELKDRYYEVKIRKRPRRRGRPL